LPPLIGMAILADDGFTEGIDTDTDGVMSVHIQEAILTLSEEHNSQAARLYTALMQANEQIVELHHQANHDELTGLLNRRGFLAVTESLLGEDRLVEPETRFSHLIYMDLDNFGQVNKIHGHDEGDLLLSGVGRVLSNSRPNDVIARIGGDEFITITSPHEGSTKDRLGRLGDSRGNKTAKEHEKGFIDRISHDVNEKMIRMGHEEVTVSIGCVAMSGFLDLGSMISEADNRMREQKYAKKSTGTE